MPNQEQPNWAQSTPAQSAFLSFILEHGAYGISEQLSTALSCLIEGAVHEPDGLTGKALESWYFLNELNRRISKIALEQAASLVMCEN